MTILTIAVVLLGGWLTVLTILALGLARQMALIDVAGVGGLRGPRLDFDADGPPIGADVPAEVLRQLREKGALSEGQQHAVMLLMSASCGPCRELAERLVTRGLVPPEMIFILAGRVENTADLRRTLSVTGRPVVLDPVAHDTMQMLNIHSSPFLVWMDEGRVARKVFGRSADHVERILTSTWREAERDTEAPFTVRGG